MKPLFETYRPSTWADVVGQDKAISRFRAIAKRGIGGRSFWITGQSGTGKTTIARLIAGEIADDYWTTEIDATALTVAELRNVESNMRTYGGGKGGKAYIVNEAHGLRADVIRQLLVLLERLPDHVVIIFTTTNDGQDSLFADHEDSHPLLSRCVRLDLARRGITEPMAERCKAIAESEGLDGRSIEDYVKLLRRPEIANNMRAALNLIEVGGMLD